MNRSSAEGNPDSIDLYATITEVSHSINSPKLQLRFRRSRAGSSYNSSVFTEFLSISHNKMQFPKVNLSYNFQAMQDLFIELLSSDGNTVIGMSKTNLVHVSRENSQGMQLDLANQDGKKLARLTLKSDNTNDLNESREEYTFTVTWKIQPSLIESFMCCYLDQYSMKVDKFKFQKDYPVYRSENVPNIDGLVKFQFKFNIKDLCFSKIETKIRFQLQKNSQEIIAETTTTLKQLLQNSQVSQLNQSISGRYKKEDVGRGKNVNITIDFMMITAYRFIDYVKSKMQFFLMIAIDYTYSNMHHQDPKSLHNIPPGGRSQYQMAASGIVNVLMQYDNDKKVPTYGFGAIPKMPNYIRKGVLSHCFPINGNEADPNLVDTNGVMEGIMNVLPHLEFAAPTVYQEVIKKAYQDAEIMKKLMKGYVVLLLMTDGLNKDMDDIRDLIVNASFLPLSIIIVAIGNNLQALKLKELQNKNELMSYDQKRPKRNIVQFVRFNQVEENDIKLAEKTMAVVKQQIEEYHLLSGLTPQSYNIAYSKATNV